MKRGDTLQTPIYMKRSIPGEKDKFAVSHDFLLSRSVFLAWRGRCMIPIDCYWSQSQEVLFIKTIRQRQGRNRQKSIFILYAAQAYNGKSLLLFCLHRSCCFDFLLRAINFQYLAVCRWDWKLLCRATICFSFFAVIENQNLC